MLHHLYDSKPLKTSMGGVRAWHPQNSLSACWMEKTLSKGVCGKKGDMKEWKRTSRRNCVPSPSLEEKPNLTRWGRGDIQANVIYTPDTLILLVAVLSLSFCPTITHTVDLFKFTFCIKKRKIKIKHSASVEWAVKLYWVIDFSVVAQKCEIII